MNLPAQTTPQILRVVVKLLRLRLQINYNSFRHASAKTRAWMVFGAFGLLALFAIILWVSISILNFLQSPRLAEILGDDLSPLLQAVPTLMLTTMFVGILLTSFGVLLQVIYLSGDMDFLLTAPVPVRAVFVAKLIQAVLPGFGLMVLFGLPVLYGLGISGGYNFFYYPLVLLEMVFMTLAASGLSALMVMAVVRVFPARHIAEVLGFIGAIFSIIISQSANLSDSLSTHNGIETPQLQALLSLIERCNVAWMPINWAGRGLVELGEGRWGTGLFQIMLVLGLCGACFWFAMVTAEGWYYTGWARMQVVSNKKKSIQVAQFPKTRPAFVSAMLAAILPIQVRGIVRRDFLMLTRDLGQISQLIRPLIFGLIYSFYLFRSAGESLSVAANASPWRAESMQILLVYVNVGMSLLIGWMLLGQLAGNGVSREGKNFWIIKTAPLRSEHLLAGKFLVAFLPALGLGWFFITIISFLRGISSGSYLFGLLSASMCLAGITGIQLGFGVLGVNFKWADPRKINSGRMGCFGSIITAIYLPLAFGSFVGPLMFASAFHQPLLVGYLVGSILGIGFNGMCAWLPLRMAWRRLEKPMDA